MLREFILDFLVQVMNVRKVEGKPSPFADFDELEQYVMASIADLPREFFTTEWQEKQLDTSERRAFLRGQIEVAVRNQGKYLDDQQLSKSHDRAGHLGIPGCPARPPRHWRHRRAGQPSIDLIRNIRLLACHICPPI